MDSIACSSGPTGSAPKVTARHLARKALLYVRQSTARQVLENQESTRRQYALRERAIALGWPAQQVETIDTDLGQSGASAVDRLGFQRLVADVSLGQVGIVLGLEVSRLARNSSDWHRLLELCALGDTLILDEDGLYNPNDFNDRLLLGLKGTISETELHFLQARMRGGLLAKAKRGELATRLPVGLVRDPLGRVVLHPDQAVREAIKLFFQTYERLGAACAVVKHFRREAIAFPVFAGKNSAPGQVLWGHLNVSRAVILLHNPRYAGAAAYGRTRVHKLADGKHKSGKLPRNQWHALVHDAHPGYITWEQYEANQRTLAANDMRVALHNKSSLAREGPSLLQGLLLCGKCGRRMRIIYSYHAGEVTKPVYTCAAGKEFTEHICQRIPGCFLDAAIGQLVIDTLTPHATEMALCVQGELQTQQDQADKQRQRQVERAQREVEIARQRYMQVDPGNRLVAATLEADWNDRLRDLDETRADVERQRQRANAQLDDAARQRLATLSGDFAAVWHDPGTPQRERKRLIRLLIEDITLLRERYTVRAQVRFRGGTSHTLETEVPKSAIEQRRTRQDAMALIGKWAFDDSDEQIALRLNALGYVGGSGKPFTASKIQYLKWAYRLGNVRERPRPAGLLGSTEMMELLGISKGRLAQLRKHGKLLAECPAARDFSYLPLDRQPEEIRLRAERAAKLRAENALPTATLDGV